MADSTPIYTPEEQLRIIELDKQAKGFAIFKAAAARSLSSGQDAATIASLLKFLSDMEQQSNSQINEITNAAKQRNVAVPTVAPVVVEGN